MGDEYNDEEFLDWLEEEIIENKEPMRDTYTQLPTINSSQDKGYASNSITVYHSSPGNQHHPTIWLKASGMKGGNQLLPNIWMMLDPDRLDDLITELMYAKAQIGG